MAHIFQKTVSDQCLILGVREALIYPFDLGDWEEIRVGFAISTTTSANDNGSYGAETVFNGWGPQANNGFLGLKDSGYTLPQTTGCLGYWGPGIDKSNSDNGKRVNLNTNTVLDIGAGPYGGSNAILSYGTGRISYGGAGSLRVPVPADATGTTSYAVLNCCRYVKGSNAGKNYVYYTFRADFAPGFQIDAATIRSTLINATPGTFPAGATGYWTDTFTIAGNNLPIPNSVFVYMPFLNNRIRIHTIVVEKIS